MKTAIIADAGDGDVRKKIWLDNMKKDRVSAGTGFQRGFICRKKAENLVEDLWWQHSCDVTLYVRGHNERTVTRPLSADALFVKWLKEQETG